MSIVRRYIISGRVQGVGYRWFARRAAERAGVAGTARNLPNGTVEVVAEGTEVALAALKEELARGPASGRVERVVEEPADARGFDAFTIIG